VALGNQLYVSYAKQDATAHDEVLGAGLGYVNIFDANGTFVKRFASTGSLNAPWGIAMAPAGFGAAAGDLLIAISGRSHQLLRSCDRPALGRHQPRQRQAADHSRTVGPGFRQRRDQPARHRPLLHGWATNQTDGVFGSIKVVTSSSPPPCTGYGC